MPTGSASPGLPTRSASAGVPASPSTSASSSLSPSPVAIEPGVARLVWLVDRAGRFGVWTTDLVGGDVRTYLADLDEGALSLRDPRLVGDEVVVIREAATSELWVLSQTAPPRLLLDQVTSFLQSDAGEVLAVRDAGTVREIWRMPLAARRRPAVIAELAVPDHGPQVGPFGFALSPDGRTMAAGWVGGPVEVIGPAPASFRDIGAPLVVADDGRILAVTGRVGDAYLFDGGRLVELAAPESDPLAVPGSGVVAWASISEDGGLLAVEVRDLIAGTSESYPAQGIATNVVGIEASLVLLEATAFDPLTRTVGVVDRPTARFQTFEASAPATD